MPGLDLIGVNDGSSWQAGISGYNSSGMNTILTNRSVKPALIGSLFFIIASSQRVLSSPLLAIRILKEEGGDKMLEQGVKAQQMMAQMEEVLKEI